MFHSVPFHYFKKMSWNGTEILELVDLIKSGKYNAENERESMGWSHRCDYGFWCLYCS